MKALRMARLRRRGEIIGSGTAAYSAGSWSVQRVEKRAAF